MTPAPSEPSTPCARRRERRVAIVGQDCIEEARQELARTRSALIASVSHETSTYGPSLMRLALSILSGQTVPPYNYVTHRLIARAARLQPGPR